MTSPRHVSRNAPANWNGEPGGGSLPAVERETVLVAAVSPINRIVVSRIVERCGLKAIVATPAEASALLEKVVPGLAILDGGADNRDCDMVLATVAACRQRTGGSLPQVILLSNRIGTTESLALDMLIDIVVAKPITPECLQPVVNRMIGAH